MSDINISYGGQAVIGGVLIQSPKGWSLGIRDKDDNLHRYYEPRIPLVPVSYTHLTLPTKA